MEKTIKVIIVDIDRHDFLYRCLKSINDAAQNTTAKIEIILITDISFSESSIRVIHRLAHNCTLQILVEELTDDIFNKSYLLNQAIAQSPEADLIAVIDVDMLVSPDYFNAIISHLVRSNLVIANGYKLNKELDVNSITITYGKVNKAADSTWFVKRNRGDYPSQIIFDKKMLSLFRKVLGRDRIYDERFTGWGGEDCLVLRVAWKLHHKNIIKIAMVDNIWYHRYHKDCKRDSHRPFFNKVCKEIDYQFNQFSRGWHG